MDDYGVVMVGDHLLSIPGLIFYLVLIAGGIWLANKLVKKSYIRSKVYNYLTAWSSVIALVTWGFLLLGLNFYVLA